MGWAFRAVAAASFLVWTPVHAAPSMARTLPPVEVFGQLPEISAAKFSPDGQHFAAVQAFRGKEAVVVYRVGPTEDTKPTVLPSDAWRVRSISQSELMYDAMKNAGKSVEFVKLEGDDHYLTLAASRIRMLSEVERFLAAHLGATPVAQNDAGYHSGYARLHGSSPRQRSWS